MEPDAFAMWFGTQKTTEFGRQPEHIRPILDEFLEGSRKLRNDPDYLPGPSDRKTWIAGAHKLYNEFNHYKTGFITWAILKNAKNFPDTEYVKWPWSLRYLWEKYNPKKLGRDHPAFDDATEEGSKLRREYYREVE